MTKTQSTSTTAAGKAKGSKKTAAVQAAADALTAERIRAILSDPKTLSSVTEELQSLIGTLGAATDAPASETPDFYVHAFEYGAESLRLDEVPSYSVEKASQAAEQIACFAERHEPQAYKVARRCSEIWEAAEGNGANYFLENVDAVLEGGDGLMPNPDHQYFVPLFVEAFDDRGPRDRKLRRLLDLIRRIDEGADLNQLAEEAEQESEARAEACRPKDARLVDALSTILRDPLASKETINRIGDLMCNLSNETQVDDLHPDVFATLARVYIREARKGAAVKVGRSERAEKAWLRKHLNEPRPWTLQRYLTELEEIAGM